MINIDDRILSQIDRDELWLLIHIVKRFNERFICWPSNKKLCFDTKFSLKKMQAIKKALIEKGILIAKTRYFGAKQGSNEYMIDTEYIGVYVSAKRMPVSLQDDDNHRVSQIYPPLPPESDLPPPPESDLLNKVLTTEVLTIDYVSNDTDQKNISDQPDAIEDQNYEGSTTIGDRGTGQEKEEKKKVKKEKKAPDAHSDQQAHRSTETDSGANETVEGGSKTPAGDRRSKGRKNASTAPCPCYARFVDVWNVAFPNLLNFPRDGKHIKHLIEQTKKYLTDGGKPADPDAAVNMFQYVVTWTKDRNHWCSGKGLPVFDSKYLEIIFEIKHGAKKGGTQSLPSAHIFSKYSHLMR